ncbi:MAG TPA: hypothetical protein VFM90_10530, partial [Cyclobacteriaceae bacterium]|nr:hypothetical protein [Cyclobacteriaceae bacterium]
MKEITAKQFLLITFVFFYCSTGFSQADTAAVNSILKFQRELDAEYKEPKTSPLSPEMLKTFEGLPYFSIDLKYVVEATLTVTP